ncbi:MAG: FMN-binding protein [Bacteroidia bacterium]|nr:FMN-binding protein [Bacteroidia bacterium]
MSRETQQQNNSNSTKMLVAMVGIGVICALLIVFTFEQTLPVIAKNKAEALEKAIFKVVPNASSFKAFQWSDKKFIEVDKSTEGELLYAGYNSENAFAGLAIQAAGQGYADVIRILYGYDVKSQKVVGFYVLETKETPGLGDKIEKEEHFLANFEGLDVSLNDNSTIKNEIETVKQGTKENAWEIDGITGATISSRAIGDILKESTTYWMPIIQGNKNIFRLEE